MSASQPLKGIELIDCAKANAKQGLETASELCGYGTDLTTFQRELHNACQQIGVEISELSDLITDRVLMTQVQGVEVAPDTVNDL